MVVRVQNPPETNSRVKGCKLGRAGSLTQKRLDRLRKLNPILSTGGYILTELSARFGVSMVQIQQDRKYIERNWWREEENTKTKPMRRKREIELEYLKRLAIESYHISRQDKEEITTAYDKRKCVECEGTGRLPKCRCLNCEGLGYVLDERITRKVVGQAGDAAFLGKAIDCVKEMIQLRGLRIEVPKKLKMDADVGVQHTHTIDVERYKNVDPELLLQAMGAISQVENQIGSGKVVDGEVLKVEDLTEEKE